MPRTIYMRIAFDGTDFHGFQNQPGLRTVQGVLEAQMARVLRHPAVLFGSSRTDAGVHATGMASSFVTERDIPTEKLFHALGSRLPDDLGIVELREVHPRFHARHDALGKTYRYRIHNDRVRPVSLLSQRYMYHCWQTLDLDRMRAAARCFEGTMDFSAMAGAGCQRSSMVRTVRTCGVEREGAEVRITVEGNGFLYKQVRNMVGTLLSVGNGKFEPEAIPAILESLDRAQAGPTAPALGLCLCRVEYPPERLEPPATP